LMNWLQHWKPLWLVNLVIE